jgi:hypothetical protein
MRLLLLLATFGILGTVSAQTAPDSLPNRIPFGIGDSLGGSYGLSRVYRNGLNCTGCPVVGGPHRSAFMSPYEGFSAPDTLVLPDSLARLLRTPLLVEPLP